MNIRLKAAGSPAAVSVSMPAASSPAIRLPSAEATNQKPIIWLTKRSGARREKVESPTGLSKSSATVCRKKVPTRNSIDTLTPVIAVRAAGTSKR